VTDPSETVVQLRSGGTTWRVVMEPRAVVANVYLDRWRELPTDATISGDPLPMYLWLWGRGPRDPLQIDGDADAADRLRDRMVVATQ
jgi:hypothetical protein